MYPSLRLKTRQAKMVAGTRKHKSNFVQCRYGSGYEPACTQSDRYIVHQQCYQEACRRSLTAEMGSPLTGILYNAGVRMQLGSSEVLSGK